MYGCQDVEYVNQYDGIIEDWKARLIVARARRKGFRRDDIQDVQQELVLEVMRFQYDPGHQSGATEQTALIAMIDKKLCFILRQQIRARKRRERMAQSFHTHNFHGDEAMQPGMENLCCLACCVREMISRLPEDLRQVAVLLSRGFTKTEIAEKLGVTARTIRSMTKRIRVRFEAAGYSEKEVR